MFYRFSTNSDMFHRLLLNSDPLLSMSQQLLQRKPKQLTNEMKDLLDIEEDDTESISDSNSVSSESDLGSDSSSITLSEEDET